MNPVVRRALDEAGAYAVVGACVVFVVAWLFVAAVVVGSCTVALVTLGTATTAMDVGWLVHPWLVVEHAAVGVGATGGSFGGLALLGWAAEQAYQRTVAWTEYLLDWSDT